MELKKLFSGLPDDDPKPVVAAAYSAQRPLIASASPINVSSKVQAESARRRQSDNWQKEAYFYFKNIGELYFAFTLLGSVMSRVRLYPAVVTDTDLVPSALGKVEGAQEYVEEAERAMKLLGTANGGIPGLLASLTTNISIAGEAYLVQFPAQVALGIPEQWKICSVSELMPLPGAKSGGSQWGIKSGSASSTADIKPLPPKAFVGRIWRPDPEYSDQAISSLLPLIPMCKKLLIIDDASDAAAKSMMNAGILYVPDSISASAAHDGELPESQLDPALMDPLEEGLSDTFVQDLTDALVAGVSDPNSVTVIAPFVMTGPDGLAESIKHISLTRELDPQMIDGAEKALDRIMQGVDLPKNVVSGLANIKYSNAVQIEESLYKSHIEPLCLLIVDTLTTVFLRPVLRAMGVPEDVLESLVIWYDASSLTAKPNKAEAATVLYDKMAISSDALRKASGFSDADAPTAQELAIRAVLDRGQMSEALTNEFWRLFMPDVINKLQRQYAETLPDDLAQAVGINNGSQAPVQGEPQAEAAPTPPEGLNNGS